MVVGIRARVKDALPLPASTARAKTSRRLGAVVVLLCVGTAGCGHDEATGPGPSFNPTGSWVSVVEDTLAGPRSAVRDVRLDLRDGGAFVLYDDDPRSVIGPRVLTGRWFSYRLTEGPGSARTLATHGLELTGERSNGVPSDRALELHATAESLVLPDGQHISADGPSGVTLLRGTRLEPVRDIPPPPAAALLARLGAPYQGWALERLDGALALHPSPEVRQALAASCVEGFLSAAPEITLSRRGRDEWMAAVAGVGFPVAEHLRAVATEAAQSLEGRALLAGRMDAMLEQATTPETLRSLLEIVEAHPEGMTACAPRIMGRLAAPAVTFDARVACARALGALRHRPALIPLLRVSAWHGAMSGRFADPGEKLYQACMAALDALGPQPSALEVKEFLGLEAGVQARHYAEGFEADSNSMVGIVEEVADRPGFGAVAKLRRDASSRFPAGEVVECSAWLLQVMRGKDGAPRRGPRPSYSAPRRVQLEGTIKEVAPTERPNLPYVVELTTGQQLLLNPRQAGVVLGQPPGRACLVSYWAPPDAPIDAPCPVEEIGLLGRFPRGR